MKPVTTKTIRKINTLPIYRDMAKNIFIDEAATYEANEWDEILKGLQQLNADTLTELCIWVKLSLYDVTINPDKLINGSSSAVLRPVNRGSCLIYNIIEDGTMVRDVKSGGAYAVVTFIKYHE